MKTLRTLFAVVLVAVMLTGCKAFHTLTASKQKTAQGRPYELVVVVNQPLWMGDLGDTLRSVLAAPIDYLPQTEPEFDVMRVTPDGFTNIVVDHRNILKVVVDPALTEAAVGVQYNLTAAPQIVLTLQGPTEQSLIDYLNANGDKLVYAVKQAERDRAIDFAKRFGAPNVEAAVKERFGITMHIPKGYFVAANEPDFIWARYEQSNTSQGFMLYSYPAEGAKSLTPEALTAARNRFVSRVPGPSEGSYMTTSEVFPPTEVRAFRLEGRLWVEMRGFWDVKNDFMGGPFVSYSTIDTTTGYVVTLDCYVYAPKLPPHKRNLMHAVEHLFYTMQLPAPNASNASAAPQQ